MAKRNHRRGGRTTPKGTRPRQLSGRPVRQPDPPFVGEAAELLRESSPFGLMAMASGILEITTPRPLDLWPGSERERVDGPSLFASFVDSGWPSLSALALAIAAMHPDAELADQIRQSVDVAVLASGPRWLASMGTAEITGTWLQNDLLGDGENVVVAWRWSHGGEATAFVYIDHNMGTIVKDAFVVPEDGDAVVSEYIALQEASMSTVPFDPATAKARVLEAIERSERTVTLAETDSWPSCRPMVEWIVRQLPDGGRGFDRPEWSEDDRDRLLDEFVASTHGTVAGLSGEQVRTLAEPLVWFACDYGPGDPLRWSPVAVEIVLADWYPRKVFGMPDQEMRRLPDVLTGFVRFAHEATSIPRPLTRETVDAVEAWRPDFMAAIGRPGRGPEANAVRLARIAAGYDPDDFDGTFAADPDAWDDGLDDWDDWDDLDDDEYLARAAQMIEADLLELAGGVAELEALTDEPLGNIEFDWSAVPAAIREPTAESLDHLDRWASEHYDDEVRTIARAVLAGVVAADPSVFKRSQRTDALAAAILAFLAKRLTGRMSAKERREMPWQVSTQKELAEATGVSASSISSRSQTVANVVERADIDWPRLLHSTQRAEMLETKRLIAEWRSREP